MPYKVILNMENTNTGNSGQGQVMYIYVCTKKCHFIAEGDIFTFCV